MSHLFAHPVLAPWLSDYPPPAYFGISAGDYVPADVLADRLSVVVEYQLQCTTIEALISCRNAAYATLATSPRTMFRELHTHSIQNDQETSLSLKMSDFAHDITLTPYVIATSDVVLPVTNEHDAEFGQAGRTEFELLSGTVLAIGDAIRLSNSDHSVTSIIDIVSSARVEPGQFLLDYEDTRIKVLVNREDQAGLNTMRAGSSIARATLFPGLYLHALVGGISKLSFYKDSEWAAVIHSALERNGIYEEDQERLAENAQVYAQKLLGSPLGQLLQTFNEANDDD